jgi:hypothetical protein
VLLGVAVVLKRITNSDLFFFQETKPAMPEDARLLAKVGAVYSEEQLVKVAQKFPERLEYRDGAVYSREEILDDQHWYRWKASLQYQVEQMTKQEDQEAFDRDHWSKMMNKVVEPTEEGFKLYLVHPQWGGYGVPAEVEFPRQTGSLEGGPGCFDLQCYHDGDFPTTEVEFERHCCSAEQFIRFGLDVLETQLQYQQDRDGNPVQLDTREQLEDFAARIQKLLSR